MTRTRRFTQAALLAALAIGVASVPAHAQSPLDGFNPGANNDVNALAVQADGKILVGGTFTALGGGTGVTTRQRIGRLNVDGTVDAFNPGANGIVNAIAVQSDGKILVAARSQSWEAAGLARPRATTSGGSTPTARSTPPSIRARTATSSLWSCSPTGRSWSAARSRR